MMLLKCCTQYISKFGKLSSGHWTGKGQFSFQSQRTTMFNKAKECSSYHTVALISHASKVMLKILQIRLQQYENSSMRTSRCSSWIQKRQRNQRSNCQHLLNHRESKKIPPKIYFCFIDYARAFVWITTNWKILKQIGNTRPPYLSPEKPVCRSRSNIQNQTQNNRLV